MGDRFQTRSNENSKLEEGLRGGLNRARNLKGASPATLLISSTGATGSRELRRTREDRGEQRISVEKIG